MKAILVGMVLVSSIAFGSTKHQTAEKIYLNAKGEKIKATDALISSLNGEPIYQCSEVAAQVSKSGSSIALKHKGAK